LLLRKSKLNKENGVSLANKVRNNMSLANNRPAKQKEYLLKGEIKNVKVRNF
jgi:hypothetical protein